MSSLRDFDGVARGRGADRRSEEIWMRLEELLGRVEKAGPGVLGDRDLGDLGRLYRAATTSLAQARSLGSSTRRIEYLNRLVSRGHAALYGRSRRGSGLGTLLWSPLAFPQVVRQTWPFHLTALLLILLSGFYGYHGALADPEWGLEILPASESRTPYADREELRQTLLMGRPDYERAKGEPDFQGGHKALFASFLWANNTRVGLLAFFSGILGGIPTIILDLYNGLLIGVYTATFHRHGLAYEWWAWILPHGVTEFLAIILLSGGGLLIGHRVVAPGARSRVEALGSIRGQVLHLLLFAFPMFFVAAAIESWVRQSGMTDGTRYIFAAATALFWTGYFLWGHVPERARRFREARTIAEEWAPTPTEEELLAGLGVVRKPTRFGKSLP
ncbi:MAG: stage II sporulation protein M [Planctomycetota bacterium]|nr:stage II sporulation protein M [Planctomycetota bacterium]